MSCDPEFIALLTIAGLAVGILIGILIMVCYRRIECNVASSDTQRHLPQHDDHVITNMRRASEYTLPQMYSTSGTHIPSSSHHYPGTASVFHEPHTSLPALGGSNCIGQRSQVAHRSNSEPAHSPVRHIPGDPYHQEGTNNVNKKTRKYSTNSDARQGSNRSDYAASHNNNNNNNTRYGEDISPTPQMTSDRVRNACPSETNIKEPGDKAIPFSNNPFARPALPMGDIGESCEKGSDIDDMNDATLVKMIADCPDDIRKIFYPSETSKTIFLREKKLVYICKMVDDNGGLLELENMGISLFVPPGAIPFNQHSLVTLVLNWDLNDNPYMDKREALVSPVVYCGPHATSFDRPCILRFKHCAYDTRFAKILTSQTDLFETKSWQDFDADNDPVDEDGVGEDGEETPIVQSGVSLSVNECEVEIPHFSLFTCIMRSKLRRLKKWIQVAVFTHDIGPERRHQQIRMYFLNKTPCALQWAIQNEAQYNFSLACPDTTFLFMEAGENMMIHLSYISEGWEAVGRDTEEPVRSVFFEEIWHGACPHASMCFRKINSFPDLDLGGSGSGNTHIGDSTKSTGTGMSSESAKRRASEIECSEINIALRLNQELCENLSVPLNVLAHNLKVKISDTQVKVIDEGPG